MSHIRSLTGVRVVAALWVVGFHYRGLVYALWPDVQSLEPLLGKGYLAVPFFFLLSGFILSHVYLESYSLKTHADFLWLRAARIWPLHAIMLFALAGYVIAGAAARGSFVQEESYRFRDLPLELMMIRSWASARLVWNFPAWSIHCEWFAYVVLFPSCH
jgi:peptidoglycan/LPS O-acetylase OafA/YrhL